MAVYESLIKFTTLGLIVVVLLLILYYITAFKQREEWERRILIVVLFFAVHELSFFLNEAFIYQLTNMLFIIALLYSLAYVFSFERRLKELEELRREFLKGLGEIKDIKEIRRKLGGK